jgi:hypothetical protein
MKNCLRTCKEVNISLPFLPFFPSFFCHNSLEVHASSQENVDHLFLGLGKAIQEKCSIRYLESELCFPLMFMSQGLVNTEIFLNTLK